MGMIVFFDGYGYWVCDWIWLWIFSKPQDHGLFCRFLRLFSDFHVMETTDDLQPSCVAAMPMSGEKIT